MANIYRLLMRLKRHDNRWNVLGYFIGFAVFMLAVTEINNLCAPKINWDITATREVFSFLWWHWYLAEGAWYNMMMWMLGVGFTISSLSLFLAFKRMRFYLSKVKQNG